MRGDQTSMTSNNIRCLAFPIMCRPIEVQTLFHLHQKEMLQGLAMLGGRFCTLKIEFHGSSVNQTANPECDTYGN